MTKSQNVDRHAVALRSRGSCSKVGQASSSIPYDDEKTSTAVVAAEIAATRRDKSRR